jgi:hypothetical protein
MHCSLASERPCGKGRDEPNQHPKLAEPARIKFNPLRPCSMLYMLVGPSLFAKLCSIVWFLLIVACCEAFIYVFLPHFQCMVCFAEMIPLFDR